MLSIAKLSAGQEDYFLEVEHERLDTTGAPFDGAAAYYADPREAPGRWAGAGSARLGLGDAVQPDHLRRLFAGLNPTTGAPLRLTSGSDVAAFDLTFSAPKSVSVLFGLGDDSVQDVVRRGHDHAAAEALRYLERNAAAVRRGHGGAVVLPAEGLVAAVFRHRTSRSGHPQLHSHVVVANIGFGPMTGGLRSTADAYTGTPRRRAGSTRRSCTASSLGRWASSGSPCAMASPNSPASPPTCPGCSVAGAPRSAALETRGVSGPRASELAALATRRAKRGRRGPPELRDGWRRRAAEIGWHSADLADVVNRATLPKCLRAASNSSSLISWARRVSRAGGRASLVTTSSRRCPKDCPSARVSTRRGSRGWLTTCCDPLPLSRWSARTAKPMWRRLAPSGRPARPGRAGRTALQHR